MKPSPEHNLVSWFLRAHRAHGTKPIIQIEQTNRGRAVSIEWREHLWAWIWIDLIVPEYAVGWPEGSSVLIYPRTANRLAEYVALEASPAAA